MNSCDAQASTRRPLRWSGESVVVLLCCSCRYDVCDIEAGAPLRITPLELRRATDAEVRTMSLVGETFLDLLQQDEVWRTSDGRVLALSEMESSHRRAVLRLLEEMAAELYAERYDELLVAGYTRDELLDA